MNKSFIVIGGQSDCFDSPISVVIESPSEFSSIRLLDMESKTLVPCQWECVENGVLLTWIEPELKRLTSKKYEATFSQDPIESGGAGVELRDTADGNVDVVIGGRLFTKYRYGPVGDLLSCTTGMVSNWQRPFMHPVMGPYGDPITRRFPVEEVPGETRDHIPHFGLYTAHGSVNGVSTWGWTPEEGFIAHREFSVLESGPVFGHMVTHNEWVSPDNKDVILEDTRDLKFYNTKDSYVMDYSTTFVPANGDVLWDDFKNAGTIIIRVATSMDVVNGGRLENSFGGINQQECWGRRAHWCDYSGPVNDKWAGIALMEHNKSFRHPTYWHARDYGLLAANPFGVSIFESVDQLHGEIPTQDNITKQMGEGEGSYVQKPGESIGFKFRVYVHAGDATEGNVAEKYNNYVNVPRLNTDQTASLVPSH